MKTDQYYIELLSRHSSEINPTFFILHLNVASAFYVIYSTRSDRKNLPFILTYLLSFRICIEWICLSPSTIGISFKKDKLLANPGSVGSTICVSGGFSIPIKRILELQTESKGHSDIVHKKIAGWREPYLYQYVLT